MDQRYLGDSYDVVKRFWAENLRPIGQLYAHEKFIPKELREEYALVTSISILRARPTTTFGILLDPNTGVPLPTENIQKETRRHAPLQFLVNIVERLDPEYLICFDQSYHRHHKLNRKEQRRQKLCHLRGRGLHAFYYVSHAPFLFVASSLDTLRAIREQLIGVGIPESRIDEISDDR